VQVNQGLHGTYKDILSTYWQNVVSHLESDTPDYTLHQIPLARIKKVMKADPEVKMISAEAPILFAKGCDIFITELTMRAWIHAEENKRRTLQRSDIAAALAKSDMFDFLIDIVPCEKAAPDRMKNYSGQKNCYGNTDGNTQEDIDRGLKYDLDTGKLVLACYKLGIWDRNSRAGDNNWWWLSGKRWNIDGGFREFYEISLLYNRDWDAQHEMLDRVSGHGKTTISEICEGGWYDVVERLCRGIQNFWAVVACPKNRDNLIKMDWCSAN